MFQRKFNIITHPLYPFVHLTLTDIAIDIMSLNFFFNLSLLKLMVKVFDMREEVEQA